jgi:hypothetical protein
VYDKKKCPDCSALLVSPHVQLSSVGCPEHGHHRTIRCLDCGHVMLEPRCDAEQGGIGSLYDRTTGLLTERTSGCPLSSAFSICWPTGRTQRSIHAALLPPVINPAGIVERVRKHGAASPTRLRRCRTTRCCGSGRALSPRGRRSIVADSTSYEKNRRDSQDDCGRDCRPIRSFDRGLFAGRCHPRTIDIPPRSPQRVRAQTDIERPAVPAVKCGVDTRSV